jgi:hypothetical protein
VSPFVVPEVLGGGLRASFVELCGLEQGCSICVGF